MHYLLTVLFITRFNKKVKKSLVKVFEQNGSHNRPERKNKAIKMGSCERVRHREGGVKQRKRETDRQTDIER